jgi:alkanesulfonate monooxygenase SsuD/methylene tetrahydromethanopterin reductase-like flavin-dependent oxidoreductase (luciferase family)
MSHDSSAAVEADAGRFATTRWSVVLAASGDDDPRSQDALARLCAAYWHPLHAFVRRHGLGPEDAEKMAVYRLRQRYRELLRREIAQTVGTPAEVEEEIRELFAALQS